jgi:pimeloyl-ACP methyl ester carboxylesterase
VSASVGDVQSGERKMTAKMQTALTTAAAIVAIATTSAHADLHFATPYDVHKAATVVFVHGWLDSERTWSPMLYTLKHTPAIVKNYNLCTWGWSTTTLTWSQGAELLEVELSKFKHSHPSATYILVGHSKGGALVHKISTDPTISKTVRFSICIAAVNAGSPWAQPFRWLPGAADLAADTQAYRTLATATLHVPVYAIVGAFDELVPLRSASLTGLKNVIFETVIPTGHGGAIWLPIGHQAVKEILLANIK